MRVKLQIAPCTPRRSRCWIAPALDVGPFSRRQRARHRQDRSATTFCGASPNSLTAINTGFFRSAGMGGGEAHFTRHDLDNGRALEHVTAVGPFSMVIETSRRTPTNPGNARPPRHPFFCARSTKQHHHQSAHSAHACNLHALRRGLPCAERRGSPCCGMVQSERYAVRR